MLQLLLMWPLVAVCCLLLVNVFKLYNKYSWVSYRHLGLVFSLAHFGMSILVVFQFVVVQTLYVVSAVSVQRYSIWDVFGFDLLLGLNGMSAGFILLSSFIFLTCSVSLWRRVGDVTEYLSLILLLQFFVTGFFLVQDLLLIYIFFEGAVLPMFILIGRWGSGASRINASYYFLLYTVLGSAPMLYGICSIYVAVGTTSLPVLYSCAAFSEASQAWYFIFFFVGFAVKVPLFPLHLWLPEAHVEAPTEGSVILSGVLLKMGVYGIYKICFALFSVGAVYYAPIIRVLGLLGVLYGGVMAFSQLDVKRVVAYSSVAHTNLVLVSLFSFTREGLFGATILSFGHGFVSAGLFFLVGFLYDRYETRNVTVFGGLSQVMPLCSFWFFLLVLCNVGTPLTFNFVGEFLAFNGIYKQSSVHCFLACGGILFGLLYSFWLYSRLFFGVLQTAYIKAFVDLTKLEFYIMLPYGILSVGFGIYPGVVLNLCTWL